MDALIAGWDVAATPYNQAKAVLTDAITRRFQGRIALVSSFGTESAVLLGLVAEVDPATPVLFIDTHKHFGETLRYRDRLTKILGLRDVRSIALTKAEETEGDPDGLLFSRNVDACCAIRKVVPLARALAPFAAWINGRKGHHGGQRAALEIAERDGERVKLNPLARWTADDVAAYVASRNLPPHPLVEDGYLSVGCYTCSSRSESGNDVRSGRWAGTGKVECGIHTQLGSTAA